MSTLLINMKHFYHHVRVHRNIFENPPPCCHLSAAERTAQLSTHVKLKNDIVNLSELLLTIKTR